MTDEEKLKIFIESSSRRVIDSENKIKKSEEEIERINRQLEKSL